MKQLTRVYTVVTLMPEDIRRLQLGEELVADGGKMVMRLEGAAPLLGEDAQAIARVNAMRPFVKTAAEDRYKEQRQAEAYGTEFRYDDKQGRIIAEPWPPSESSAESNNCDQDEGA